MTPDKHRAPIAGLNWPMAGLSLFIAFFVLYGSRFSGGHLLDGQGYVLGRDFLNFWHYGIAAWRDDALRFYDPAFYNGLLDALVPGYDYPDQNWSYPPHYMLLAAPFGLIGYYWALAIYTGLGLALYWRFAVCQFERVEERIALFAMPTVTVYLLCGQISALLAVVLLAVYRTLDRRPVAAGLLIALMTVKPQIGLLIPLFLILTRRWKVLLSAVAATLAFIGLSIAVHGVEPWRHYLSGGLAVQSTTLVDSNVIVMGLMPTAFVDMIQLGAGTGAAMAAQAGVSLAAIAAMWATIGSTRDRFLQFAALLAASFVVTPYLMSYDTLVLGWIMLSLMNRAEPNGWQTAIYGLAMAICPLGVALALYPLPGAPLVLFGVLFWVWQTARRQEACRGDDDSVLNRAAAP